jgi:hypothetical protein
VQANSKTKAAVTEWLDAIKDDASIDDSIKLPIQKIAAAVLKDGGKCGTKHLNSDIVIELLDKVLGWPSERLEELVLVVTGKNAKVADTTFDAQVSALEPKETRY